MYRELPKLVWARMQQAQIRAEEELTGVELDACGESAGIACLWVLRETNSGVLAKAVDFVLAKPLKIMLILIVAMVATRLVRRLIRRFVRSFDQPIQRTLGSLRDKAPAALLTTDPLDLRAAQRAQTVGAVLRSIITVVIWTTALLMVLGEFGVNLAPLLASAGIVGVALGFGAQSLVKDFLSGMFTLVEDQFGVGDIIDLGDASGVVEGVSLRTTRLRAVDGTVWHVPNGEIRRVGNKSQQWSRALIDFEVAYGTDLARAKATIKRVADSVWQDEAYGVDVLEEPEVWGVEAFAPDGVAIRLVLKTLPSSQWKVMRELRQRVKTTFDAEGIEIPLPQRALWVRPDPPDAADSHAADGKEEPEGDSAVAAAHGRGPGSDSTS